MATNKTSNLKLNSWIGNDRVSREEINENFDILDTQLEKTVEDIEDRGINVFRRYNHLIINNDWTQAINEAMEIADEGVPVILPPIIMKINDSLKIPKDNTILLGILGKTIIEWDVGNLNHNHLLTRKEIGQYKNLEIKGVTFDGKRRERGLKDEQSFGALNLTGIESVRLTEVEVRNTVGPGISGSNGIKKVSLTRCKVSDTGHHDIYFSKSVEDLSIEDCILDSPASDIINRNHEANIFKLRSDGIENPLKNIKLKNVKMGMPRGVGTTVPIAIYVSSSSHFINLDISDLTTNYLNETSSYHAIWIASGSKFEGLKIRDNKLIGSELNDHYGVFMGEPISNFKHDIDIKDNIIERFRHGVFAYNAKISFNKLFDCVVSLRGFNSKINNNTITSSKNNAIGVHATETEAVLNEIDLTGTGTRGLYLADNSDKRFIENTLKNCVEGVFRQMPTQFFRNVLKNIFVNCATKYTNILYSNDNVFEQRSGVTSSRPSSAFRGETFFDITINKQIIWNGSSWVDTMGNLA